MKSRIGWFAVLAITMGAAEAAVEKPDQSSLTPSTPQADQADGPGRTAARAVGICRPAPNNSYSIANALSPVVSARGYFKLYEQRTFSSPAIATVVQQPRHGVLRLITESDRGILFSSSSGPIDPADPGYAYLPEPGYVGKDSATILVDFGGGNKVKVQYYFQAIDEPILVDSWMEDYCSEKGPYWKISSTLDANGISQLGRIRRKA